MNKTYCAKAFYHQHIDTRGKARLCCYTNTLLDSIDFYSDEYEAIREQMIDGNPIDHCSGCYQREENNEISPRLIYNKEAEQYATLPPAPIDIDLRLRNSCNLACVMCNASNSSTIAKNQGMEEPYKQITLPTISKDIRRVYMAGGEPFMIKEFQNMLDNIHNDDCEIIINTNLTIRNDIFVEKLKRFSNVSLTVSMDAVGHRLENIRHGLVWEHFEENFDYFNDIFPIHINTVLMENNKHDMIELAEWINLREVVKWTIAEITSPASMAVTNVDSVYYDQLLKTPQLKQLNNLHSRIAIRSIKNRKGI